MTAAKLVSAMLRVNQRMTLIATPPAVYLCLLLLKPSGRSEWVKVFVLALGFTLVVNLGIVVAMVRRRARAAVEVRPAEAPGERLGRLLGLPVAISVRIQVLNLITLPFLLLAGCLWIGRSAWLAVPCFAAAACYSLLANVGLALGLERELLPLVREEFQRVGVAPLAPGRFRRRLSWFLVYVFALSLVTAMVSVVIVLGSQLMGMISTLVPDAHDRSRLFAQTGAQLFLPLILVLAVLVVLTVIIARRVAQQEVAGTNALAQAIDALARGQPIRPDWTSTDELGDLAFALASAVERLKTLGGGLRGAAHELVAATEQLGHAVQIQMRELDYHNPVLLEAVYVASDIRKASEVAGEQVQAVLTSSVEAQRLGQQGGAALERTSAELEAIRVHVSQMASQSRSLGERMGEVLSVTEVVKQLADQSSLLALNAAVEAVRAGEQGKGFSVVAREIRTLADQSLDATRRVRAILEDLARAAMENAKHNEEGHGRVEVSLAQMRGFSDSLGKLLGTVQASAEAAKQIATAVDQQTNRATEVSGAVKSLAGVMEGTLRQLSSIEESQSQLAAVAEHVRAMVESYGLVEGAAAVPGGLSPS